MIESYESKSEQIAPVPVFIGRVLRSVLFVLLFLGIFLVIGILGYHFTDGTPWIDALHNSAMILSGMGPVVNMHSNSGKIFSSCYALFSGVAFITNIGIILAPMAHRLYHRLHLEDDDDDDK